MTGPIVRQASTAGSLSNHSPVTQSSAPAAFAGADETSPSTSTSIASHNAANRFLLTPSAPLRDSPLPVSPNSSRSIRSLAVATPAAYASHASTAPPEMVERFRRLSLNSTPVHHASTYQEKRTFQLDYGAPVRAIRVPETVTERPNSTPLDQEPVPTWENDGGGEEGHISSSSDKRPEPKPLQRHADSDPGAGENPAQPEGPAWGTSFPVRWIRVQPLSFTRTRHLRNPWNGNREVKVSRDGTELEPPIGQQLLALWDEIPGTPPPSSSSQPKRGGNPRSAAGRRG